MGFVEPVQFTWTTQGDGRRKKSPVRGTRWKARYRDSDGRARSRTFPTKTEAQNYLGRISADIQRGDYIDPLERRRKFADWAEVWWQTTIKLRPTTRRGYWQLLHGHVLPTFGARAMGGIDHFDVEQFIAAKLVEGLSPKKVRDAVSVISLVMKCAIRGGGRRDNPAAEHHIPVARRKLRSGDVPDMADIERLIAQVADPYKPAVWLLAYTGLRPSELCGLRVASVDFVKRVIRVTETLMPVHRYADARYSLVGGPPKTQAGDRDIPIPGWLCDQLAAMLAARAERQTRRDRPRRLPVRPTKRDTAASGQVPPAHHPSRTQSRGASRQSADLRPSPLPRLPAHRPRRQPLAIAQRMGHSDPAVTLRVYGHLFAGIQEDLTARLDTLRTGLAEPGQPPQIIPIRPEEHGQP